MNDAKIKLLVSEKYIHILFPYDACNNTANVLFSMRYSRVEPRKFSIINTPGNLEHAKNFAASYRCQCIPCSPKVPASLVKDPERVIGTGVDLTLSETLVSLEFAHEPRQQIKSYMDAHGFRYGFGVWCWHGNRTPEREAYARRFVQDYDCRCVACTVNETFNKLQQRDTGPPPAIKKVAPVTNDTLKLLDEAARMLGGLAWQYQAKSEHVAAKSLLERIRLHLGASKSDSRDGGAK